MTDAPAPAAKKPGRLAALGKVLLLVAAFGAGAAAGGAGAVIALARFGGLPAATAPHDKPAAAAAAKVDYVEIDNAFTSNLADTGRYLQLRLSVSTAGGPTVVAAVAQHKPAIISAVLSVLGEATEADVADRVAKDRLRSQIRSAINDVLRRKTGTAGIDEVFFTSLVVQ